MSIGTVPAGGWPPLGALRAATDPAFLRGLIHAVALEYNAGSSGEPTPGGGEFFGEGGAGGDPWVPVPGYETVPCRVSMLKPAVLPGATQAGWFTPAVVSFGVALDADQRHRLLWEHPVRGPMYWYFQGPVQELTDGHGPHHWVGYCQDRRP